MDIGAADTATLDLDVDIVVTELFWFQARLLICVPGFRRINAETLESIRVTHDRRDDMGGWISLGINHQSVQCNIPRRRTKCCQFYKVTTYFLRRGYIVGPNAHINIPRCPSIFSHQYSGSLKASTHDDFEGQSEIFSTTWTMLSSFPVPFLLRQHVLIVTSICTRGIDFIYICEIPHYR